MILSTAHSAERVVERLRDCKTNKTNKMREPQPRIAHFSFLFTHTKPREYAVDNRFGRAFTGQFEQR